MKNVLIADDHPIFRDGVKRLLVSKLKSISVDEAINAQEVMNFVGEHKYDAAILDIQFPDNCGLEILDELKKEKPDLPVLMLSMYSEAHYVIKAIARGADGYLTKNDVPEELFTALRKITNGRIYISANFPNELLETVNRIRENIWQATKKDEKTLINKRKITKGWEVRLRLFRKVFRKYGSKMETSEKQKTLSSQNGKINTDRKDLSIAEDAPVSLGNLKILPNNSKASIQGYFFGQAHVVLNNRTITHWPSRKGREIFAYLLLHHKRRISRDMLMDKFWANAEPDSARNCLNVALHGIRQLLSEIDQARDYILFKDECYFFNSKIEIWLDVEEFLGQWRLGQSIEQEDGRQEAISHYEMAAGLYKGDFMEMDLYGYWQSSERENLKEIYLVILDRLSHFYNNNGRVAIAIDLCNKILQKDNCREDIHRRLMRCYYSVGLRDKGLKQFHKCRSILREELEVEPTQETIALYEKMRF